MSWRPNSGWSVLRYGSDELAVRTPSAAASSCDGRDSDCLPGTRSTVAGPVVDCSTCDHFPTWSFIAHLLWRSTSLPLQRSSVAYMPHGAVDCQSKVVRRITPDNRWREEPVLRENAYATWCRSRPAPARRRSARASLRGSRRSPASTGPTSPQDAAASHRPRAPQRRPELAGLRPGRGPRRPGARRRRARGAAIAWWSPRSSAVALGVVEALDDFQTTHSGCSALQAIATVATGKHFWQGSRGQQLGMDSYEHPISKIVGGPPSSTSRSAPCVAAAPSSVRAFPDDLDELATRFCARFRPATQA